MPKTVGVLGGLGPESTVDFMAKVLAASAGKVVSIYAQEPHRAIMIEHFLPEKKVYTVYAHITNIQVEIGDKVDINSYIANLMNAEQLDRYGWEFNHLHFEILKTTRLGEDGKLLSYSTRCKTKKEIYRRYYDPILFFRHAWSLERKNRRKQK